MDSEKLQDSIDTIASAAALGMTVNAPAGSTVYVSFAEDENEVNVIFVRGYHSTRESATNELLAFAFGVWDHDGPELAPWGDEDGPDEGDVSGVAAARNAWVSAHTDEQILDEFFGEDWWGVSELKIEKPHTKPFSRP